MKLTAAVNLALALVLALSSCAPTPVESKQGASPEVEAVRSRRHVVQKRLTAEDVLGDLHTQESATINENISASHCLGSKSMKLLRAILYNYAQLQNNIFLSLEPSTLPPTKI